MTRSRGYGLFGAAAFLGLSTAVHAANLSMRFAPGGGEVTLAPNESAVIEIVWTTAAQAKSARTLGAINNRFEVVGSDAIEVSATSTAIAGWTTSGSLGVGGPLSAFFASAEGTASPITETATAFESVVQQVTIRNVDGTSGSVEVAFRVSDPLPDAITSAGAQWTLVASAPSGQQYDIGQGSPGFDDQNGASNPAAPLVIHLVPSSGGDGGGGGGGGGGGSDPNVNANDNTTPPTNSNDNAADDGNQNDNVVTNDNPDNINDNGSDATNDNGGGNDTETDDGTPDNSNENESGGDGGVPPDDGGGDGGASDNDNRPSGGGGGGGGGGFGCGIGMIGATGWMMATLVLLRFDRRRGQARGT